jgi:short subunit dehydrogenase-like uncharacterized protein
MADRDLDLVLFGATGFTGRQAVAYLRAHAPPGLRWGVAARDPTRLGGLPPDVATLRVDKDDAAAVRGMVERTRVVASTAGPFARLSDPVVAACVEAGTDYADITGETPWVRRLIDRHHARAAASGTRIVPCCGFDSIPSDLGAWLLVDAIRHAFGRPTARVTAAFTLGGGGLNGGTAASALEMAEQGEDRALADPLLLVPPERRAGLAARSPRAAERREDLDAWLAPFVMAPINTQVVLRSAALWAERGAPYGPRFEWAEGLLARRAAAARAVALGVRAGERLLESRVGRGLVRRLVPAPGEGPSEAAMARGFVRVRYVGEADDGRRARGELSVQGDPGNRATVLFLCEAALGLALDRGRLPAGGGVLTPATALGEVLADRLRRAGVHLSAGPG